MTNRPKILCVCDHGERSNLPSSLRETCDTVDAESPLEALSLLSREPFTGMYIAAEHFDEGRRLEWLLQYEKILSSMPDGVALLDIDNTIVWGNDQFHRWTEKEEVAGLTFYAALNNPEILGPDFCPFHTALAGGEASGSVLKSDDRYFHLHAAPIYDNRGQNHTLIVTIRDVTEEILQKEKLTAIHAAGVELANLTPDEVFEMDVEDRIELLKSNILHYTKDLLNFDVVEIRLLDQATGELMPLLAVGIDEEAAGRNLSAQPKDNGVTGFVASSGKSYLCENTADDPLYLRGFEGAKSSLTVPLMLHDQVIGTFNVESPEPKAFKESDLQFLEIFSRDVALALNTLELLVAQRANAAQESCAAIHSAVALPVDAILNDAVNVMEGYIGHEPEMVKRLQSILRNARDIKQLIQTVGQKMAPAEAVPATAEQEERSAIRGSRVLVVDADTSVRTDAHKLLEQFGCIVETAHEGGEAVYMVRNSDADHAYDVIIADIRLSDMSGYDFLMRLKEIMSPVPLALMAAFGYDPGHSIVKARQAGLHPNAVLYKPFRRDQLLNTVGMILSLAHEAEDPAVAGRTSS